MFNSTQLFCVIDDFFIKFEATYWKFLKQSCRYSRIRAAQLTISEIIFIAVWYKCSYFTNFKAFFSWLKQDKRHLFKSLPCYQQLSESDGYHLKQRNKIETLFSLLKGQYNLVTSKSRSISGFLSGIYASLCAYQLTHQNKPKIQIMGSMA
ncbi:hypothetical protein [Acinetobacter sp. UBA3106]|uniref:hypothetical protein n=1 Tax=Acinetobacter sp. UBA3106 TaxID=1945936 RepID=UPI0025BC4074|nr:hypothetical protein [Acinetobacter sp. UBA3106]